MNIPLYFKFTDILRSHQCLQHQELEMHRRHSKISLGFIFQLKSPNLAISFPPLLKLKKRLQRMIHQRKQNWFISRYGVSSYFGSKGLRQLKLRLGTGNGWVGGWEWERHWEESHKGSCSWRIFNWQPKPVKIVYWRNILSSMQYLVLKSS